MHSTYARVSSAKQHSSAVGNDLTNKRPWRAITLYCVREEEVFAQEMEEEVTSKDAPPESEVGCNLYMYFVCTSLQGPYTLLDDVKPAHIRAARCGSKLLTGNLDASVQSFPPFPGQERHFLRAQISRIRHATCLCPKGLFALPEGAEEPEHNEEYSSLAVSEMSDPANWVHWYVHTVVHALAASLAVSYASLF
jgi:Radial spokehead-like protein